MAAATCCWPTPACACAPATWPTPTCGCWRLAPRACLLPKLRLHKVRLGHGDACVCQPAWPSLPILLPQGAVDNIHLAVGLPHHPLQALRPQRRLVQPQLLLPGGDGRGRAS